MGDIGVTSLSEKPVRYIMAAAAVAVMTAAEAKKSLLLLIVLFRLFLIRPFLFGLYVF